MSKREPPKFGSRLQKSGTSISRTNQSQITRTDSGTVIAGNSRISQTTIRPSGSRAAGSSNLAPVTTGVAKVRMVGAPSTSRTQSGVGSQQTTQVKLSGLPGKPIAKTKIKTVPAAKGKAGTCPSTCSNQPSAPGPFTAEVEAGRHVPPGLYFHPMKGKVTEDVNSPEKLRSKLAKYTPTSLSHYKVENVHPFKQDLAPLRKQHPDIISGVFRSLYDLPDTDFESVEQLRQQRILNQAMNPYMPEDHWTVGLREAMDLEQGEMETEDGLVEFEQSTIDRRIDGQLGSPGRSPESLCPPCAPEVCDSSGEIIENSSFAGQVQQRSPPQDYISPPEQDIIHPETHYHMEQRSVSPARIASPRGPIEARQTFHVERQMGASPHGAVVDTTMIGTRTVSPGQAEQVEITKRDRIPPPKTPPSATKRQSPLVSPGRYPSPPQFQPSPGRPQLGSPNRYPSPPQFQPSPDRPELGSPAYFDISESMVVYPGSPSRYPSPPQFQASPARPQLGSPSRYASPPQFQPSPVRPVQGRTAHFDLSESMEVYPGSPSRYPSPPQFNPSPGSQFLDSPEFYNQSDSMAVRPGSPQRSPGSPARLPSPPMFPESPTMFPFPPLESPTKASSSPKSPGSATKNKKHDLPVSFDHSGSSKSPSGPGGPLDISIPVPTSPENATIETIQNLIDEEQIDFQTSSTLAPQLQDKLDRIRGHSLLVETLQEIVPGDEVEDNSYAKSDVLASMMYSEERGVIETGSSPKKTYNALFGVNAALAVSLEGERSITVSPAAPAPLQDIVVPVGQADVDDIAVVSPEMSHFVASTEEMPKGDAYSSSVQNEISPVRIPVTKAPNAQSTLAYIDDDGKETKYIPRGELEEQKAPWDIDLDSLENLVGAQISVTSPMRSDESITKTIGRFEYILDLERPKHYSCVQLRGTQRPPWFPGYYYVMPQTGSGESPEKDSTHFNYVKQGHNLESVFAEAWTIFKPQTVKDKSEVVLL